MDREKVDGERAREGEKERNEVGVEVSSASSFAFSDALLFFLIAFFCQRRSLAFSATLFCPQVRPFGNSQLLTLRSGARGRRARGTRRRGGPGRRRGGPFIFFILECEKLIFGGKKARVR